MRSERACRAALAVALATLGLAVGACSSSRSFVVLHLKTEPASLVITGLERLDVTVSQPPALSNTLEYDAHGLTIGAMTDTDLSISFSPEQSGVVTIKVDAIGANGCQVAQATTTAVIRKGGAATATAFLFTYNKCSSDDDGGVPSPDGSPLPGCDPTGTACGAGQTCQVNCGTSTTTPTAPKNECTPAGARANGAACTTNADCAPGSQCFKYASPGCAVSICLKFCGDDLQCGAAPVDGGAADDGTRSTCTGPVQCGALLTSYRTCTFACDPRESEVAAKTTRCPAGLSCLIVGDRDQVDCACPEPSRVGTDGADCTSGNQCAPGYICNMMAGAKKCRALCRCDAVDGQCTATKNDCRAPNKACSALTNDTLFGVCL